MEAVLPKIVCVHSAVPQSREQRLMHPHSTIPPFPDAITLSVPPNCGQRWVIHHLNPPRALTTPRQIVRAVSWVLGSALQSWQIPLHCVVRSIFPLHIVPRALSFVAGIPWQHVPHSAVLVVDRGQNSMVHNIGRDKRNIVQARLSNQCRDSPRSDVHHIVVDLQKYSIWFVNNPRTIELRKPPARHTRDPIFGIRSKQLRQKLKIHGSGLVDHKSHLI
mmetsp:Transcript_56938/g.152032  ORF Transcript_56938/g.152032 Transcript_56938/m.152032 type:complete len:219 (-) Transcript_56938:872-1528(-)